MISSVVRFRRGTTSVAAKVRMSVTVACSVPSTSSGDVGASAIDQARFSIPSTSECAVSSKRSVSARDVDPSSTIPSASRSPGSEFVPDHSCRARSTASTMSTRSCPPGACPSTCRPSRIWASLISQSQPSRCMTKSSKRSSSGWSETPRSLSSFAAWISCQIWPRIAVILPGSIAWIEAYSSSSCSRRARSP